MENLREDETKQVEMLEKFDFFKRDHHLSSGGILKPDERKQWQIFCKVCVHLLLALKYLQSFPRPRFNITPSISWMAGRTAGATGLGLIVALN